MDTADAILVDNEVNILTYITQLYSARAQVAAQISSASLKAPTAGDFAWLYQVTYSACYFTFHSSSKSYELKFLLCTAHVFPSPSPAPVQDTRFLHQSSVRFRTFVFSSAGLNLFSAIRFHPGFQSLKSEIAVRGLWIRRY
jgi:hypothetical protein